LGRNYLLKDAAHRLNYTRREIDTLARLKDRVFVLLLENVTSQPQLDLITNRFSSALSTPFEIKGQKIDIEPNIYVHICTGLCQAAENPKNANIKRCYECIRNQKTG
jgi:hypothetical protein